MHQKIFVRKCAAAVLVSVACLLGQAQAAPRLSLHDQLVNLAQEITYETAAGDPLYATSLGIAGHDGELAIPSEARRAATIKQLQLWKAELAAIAATFDSRTSLRDRNDAKLLGARLTSSLNALLIYQKDRKDYARSGGDILEALATQLRALPVAGKDGATAADVNKAWDEIISRLSKAPAYISASRQMVTMPCRLHGMIGAGQLSAAPEFLNVALTEAAKSQLGERSPAFRRFLKARDPAARALEELKSFIDANVASWPENYVVSKSVYEAAMRDEELVDLGAEQIIQIGEDALAHGAAEEMWVREVSRNTGVPLGAQSGGGMAPAGPALVGYYGERIQELAEFVTRRQVVTVPKWLGTMQVVETPPFLLPVIPTVAMEGPRLFSRSSTGYYFIPPLGSLDEAAARLDPNVQFDRDRVLFIGAHESIPGHFLQLSIARRHPNFIRKTAGFISFIEGWGYHGQEMLLRLGMYDTNLDARLVAAAWERLDGAAAVADVKFFTGVWTFQETAKYLAEQTGFSEDFAQGAVALILTRQLGYVTSYAVGGFQIRKLQAEYMLRKGAAASLRDFNDRLLSYGSVPLSVLGPELLADLDKSAEEVRAAANY